MPDQLISAMPSRAVVSNGDIMAAVRDPSTTHTGQKATLEQVIAAFLGASSASVDTLRYEDIIQLNITDARKVQLRNLGEVFASANIQWPTQGRYFELRTSNYSAGTALQRLSFFGHPLDSMAGAFASVAIADGDGPAIRFSGSVGTGSYLGSATLKFIRCNKPIWFNYRVRLNQTADTRVYLGLCSNLPAYATDNPGHSFVGFGFRNTGAGALDTTWRLITMTATAGSVTNSDSGVSVQSSTSVDLSFEINADGTSVEFFINGTSVGTIATNLPTGVNLAPSIDCLNTVNGATPGVNLYRIRGRWESLYE